MTCASWVMPGDVIQSRGLCQVAGWHDKQLDDRFNQFFVSAIANGTVPAGTVIDGEAIGSTGGVLAPFENLLDKGSETGDVPNVVTEGERR